MGLPEGNDSALGAYQDYAASTLDAPIEEGPYHSSIVLGQQDGLLQPGRRIVSKAYRRAQPKLAVQQSGLRSKPRAAQAPADRGQQRHPQYEGFFDTSIFRNQVTELSKIVNDQRNRIEKLSYERGSWEIQAGEQAEVIRELQRQIQSTFQASGRGEARAPVNPADYMN